MARFKHGEILAALLQMRRKRQTAQTSTDNRRLKHRVPSDKFATPALQESRIFLRRDAERDKIVILATRIPFFGRNATALLHLSAEGGAVWHRI